MEFPLFAALIRFAGRPGKERTGHGCAPQYLRKGGIPPHLCPLPSRERKIKEWGLSQAPPVVKGRYKSIPPFEKGGRGDLNPCGSFRNPDSRSLTPCRSAA